jgi:hypothetical protein
MKASIKKIRKAELKVISGGLDPTARLGAIRFVVAPGGKAPFPVEASVVEEDTFLVLSDEPSVCGPVEPPVHLMTRLIETRAEIPGTVLVKGIAPYKIMAIVHDVNQDPTWREEWVYQALKASLRAAEHRRIKKIGLDMLGCIHGRLNPAHFTTLLKEILEESCLQTVRHIWVRPPRGLPVAQVAAWLRAGTH